MKSTADGGGYELERLEAKPEIQRKANARRSDALATGIHSYPQEKD